MQFKILAMRKAELDDITKALKVLKPISISDEEGIRAAVAQLKADKISSFAIREAMKEAGLIEAE